MAVVDFEQAIAIVLSKARAAAGSVEEVGLLQAVGRVLAQGVTADRDQPPFDRSTRDGFAVRAAEFSSGERLRVAGVLRAGQAWPETLMSCEAIQIMTGAPIPEGADAVAMVEHVERGEGAVWLQPGRGLITRENIVMRGSEAQAGDEVLAAGTRIGAAEVALAAAVGCGTLLVRQRPRVAIVATGDELVELDEPTRPQQIRNSNSFAIAAMVEAAGGSADRLEIAPDTKETIRDRVARGREADLLVFSGGVSMGEYDLVEEVLGEFGAEFLFTGVKMQPGKPVVFGRLPPREGARECFFFGLPGNPISTQVTFHCFVEPFLRVLGGEAGVGLRWAQGTLAEAVEAKAGVTRLLPARMDGVKVRLVGWQGSGDLTANARANCYAELQPGRGYAAGEVVCVLLR